MHRVDRRGFTIYELVALLFLICLVGAFLIGLLAPIRHSGHAQGVVAQANLRSLNTGASNYAGDHDDLIFSYSYTHNSMGLMDLTGRGMTDIEKNAILADAQARNILQRSTGRTRGDGAILEAPSALLYQRYSHLVLLDWLTDRQPEQIMASPFDRNLINWQENPLGYLDAESDFPYANGMPKKDGYDIDPLWEQESVKQLWAFGSSYQVVPHAWLDDENPQYTPSADSPHHMVKGDSDEPLGGRKMTEVAHPSGKVFMYEEFDRFTDPDGLFASDPKARINMAFFDGSVRGEIVGDANSAFDPDNPDEVWEQRYLPLDTFPLPKGGLGDEAKLDLRFRWTKGGLGGIDYGGSN